MTESQNAGVYIRGDAILVTAMVKTAVGILQSGESSHARLTPPIAAPVLGDAVLTALAAYRDGVPGRSYTRGTRQPPDPFLEFSGFSSWRALERGAQYFGVCRRGESVEITPSSARLKGGFLFEPERLVRCAAVADEIGRALLSGMSK